MQNIIDETNDIDLSCDLETYLEIDWKCKIDAFGIEIKYFDCFKIGTNLYNPEKIVEISGFKVANLEYILEIKKLLNRKKNEKIIKKIEKVLN